MRTLKQARITTSMTRLLLIYGSNESETVDFKTPTDLRTALLALVELCPPFSIYDVATEYEHISKKLK